MILARAQRCYIDYYRYLLLLKLSLSYNCRFSLVYGPDHGGVIGDFTYALFLNLNNMCLTDFAPRIPGTAFALFQMMFAAITPLLMTGTDRSLIRRFG